MVKKIYSEIKQKSYILLLSIITAVSMFTISYAQSTSYVWKSVIAGGGGFVPGIIYHTTVKGLAYARTDIGGAYRWDNNLGKWLPINDMMTRNNSDYMGILSIALDRNDTNRVYMECGKYTQAWAGTGAVLASTDKGNSWTIHPLTIKIGGNEDGRGAGERLQVDPNLNSILFMGTTANGLWKSTDYAATWEKVSSFSPSNVNFVLFDPSSASLNNATQRIFVGVVNNNGQSLYQSNDGGSSWTLIPDQPTGVMAIRSVIADSLLYLTYSNYQGPNGATTGSVWKYNISGSSWTNISPSSGSYGFSGISLYPKNPDIIIVSTLDRWSPKDEVYLTTNGGTSWTPRISNATFDHSYAPYTASVNPHWLAALVMDPFDSSKAMFGTGYGIWACDNLFASNPTWYFKDQNLEETVPMQIISPPFTNLLSAMGDYDGFRHDNLDTSPPNRFYPYRGTTLSIEFAGRVPSKIVKTFNTNPYGAYSTDGGKTWRDFRGRPGGAAQGGSRTIAVSADGNTIVWAPTGASLSYSTDNGKTWVQCAGGVPAASPVADRVNPEKFYVYNNNYGQLWLSVNGGKSFYKTAIQLPSASQSQDGNVNAVPKREGDIWICTGSGGLYHSINSGASTEKITTVTAAFRLGFGKAMSPGSYPAIYLYGTVNDTLGFFRSDDSSQTWTRINDDSHQFGWIHQITGDPRVYGRCYLSAEGRGISYGEPENSEPLQNPETFYFNSLTNDSLKCIGNNIKISWSKSSDPQGKPLNYILNFFGPGKDTLFTATDTSIMLNTGPLQQLSTYVLTGYVSNGTDTTASSNNIFFPTGIDPKADSIPPDHSGISNMTSVEFAKEMSPGWNIGNSLDAIGGETAWGNPKITQKLIDSVKAAGFKSIRIPVAWSKFTNDSLFIIDTTWLKRVEEVVNYVLKDTMYAIINEHWDGGWQQPTYKDSAYVNNRLAAMWKQIAIHFRNYGDHLLFAGTNEVMVEGNYSAPIKEYYTVQNSFNQTFVNTVRSTGGRNYYRYLVVQGFNTNIDYTVNYFAAPADVAENRLMIEVHYYDPYDFTINTNSNITQWGKNATDPSKTETWANESYADGQFQKMKTKFIDKGYAVILGEYGVIARLNLGSTLLNEQFEGYRRYYMEYITGSIFKHGIVPFYWDNGGTGNYGMGIFYRNTGAQAYPDIIKAIIDAVDTTNVTKVGELNSKPDTYRLLQNYPNPFNPETTISYSLAKEGSVSLEIFDLLGRKETTIINNEIQSSGYHEISFNAENLPTGVYIYKLKAGSYISTKKMLLLK